MSVVHNERKWYLQDPLQPTKSVQTSQGELKFDETESLVVTDPSLAAEIKEKNPHFLCSELENPAFRPKVVKSRSSFIMPALPYETEWDRRHKEKSCNP